ncbi:serine/threonine-protein kinase hal4 [Thozetella sp. PMI_491]|nr:serine/threonine-protein kinase hal4 [Thozetella sp. PMI_491]
MATTSSDARTVSSQGTSQPSSIRSVDLSKSPQLAGQPGQPIPNGSTEQLAKPADKGSVKDRLTRMFSTKDTTQHSKTVTPVTTNTSVPSAKPSAPSRMPSSTDKPAEKTVAPAAPKSAKPNGKDGQYHRFVTVPDVPGGHEHHLKAVRRQEKLTDLWKGILGKKSTEHQNDNDLSLVSNWVDAMKQEKADPQLDKKAGPVPSATLVEKYGKCQEIVGRGAFGIVRISHKKAENGAADKLFAVKEFKRRPEETEKKYSKRLTAEFCISSSLRHPNVIHTLDLLKDAKGDYCEVMEYCAGGDLYTLVLAAGKLEVQEADCFFKQMMRGVEYMHEMGVAHRDLKPENLLLTTRGGLKITDFGNGECFRMAWENDAHMVSGLCGSAPYIAPEEYTDKEFDARAVDVWACGVIYMAMRTGRHLWRLAKKDEDEFYARYLEGRKDEGGYGPIESLHRARCRNVIYSILDPNPSRRITASQVLKSEWGREIKLCRAGEEGL